MQKLSKVDNQHYIITLHPDVASGLEALEERASRIDMPSIFASLDAYINSCLFNHLSELDNQIKEEENAFTDMLYRMRARTGVEDFQKLKELIREEKNKLS